MVNVTCARLTAAQAAACCGVHPATVRRWARRGLLRATGRDGSGGFRPEEVLVLSLDRFFKSRLRSR